VQYSTRGTLQRPGRSYNTAYVEDEDNSSDEERRAKAKAKKNKNKEGKKMAPSSLSGKNKRSARGGPEQWRRKSYDDQDDDDDEEDDEFLEDAEEHDHDSGDEVDFDDDDEGMSKGRKDRDRGSKDRDRGGKIRDRKDADRAKGRNGAHDDDSEMESDERDAGRFKERTRSTLGADDDDAAHEGKQRCAFHDCPDPYQDRYRGKGQVCLTSFTSKHFLEIQNGKDKKILTK
jgi:hypothetical protein